MRDNPERGDAAELVGGVAAERSGGSAAVRRGGRPQPGKRGKAAERQRFQLHLSLECIQRLDVHCGITQEQRNDVVETVLLRFLRDRGKGKTLFDPEPQEESAPKAASVFVPPPEAMALMAAKRLGSSRPLRPDTGEDRQDRTAG